MNTDSITIREATYADLAALLELQRLSTRRLGIHCYEGAQIEGVIQQLGTAEEDSRASERRCYVAEVDNEVVACGAWIGRPTRSRFETKKFATVRSIYVDPDFTGRGVARRMMGRIEADIAGAGYSDITLESTLNGAPFYRRMGYSEKRSMSLRLPGGMLFGCVTMFKHVVEKAASGVPFQSAA